MLGWPADMPESPMRIHLYHKSPTPYNDLLFTALSADPGVTLQVYHLWRGLSTRPWTVNLASGYPNRYLDTRTMGVDRALLRTAIVDRGSFFLVADWAHPSSVAPLVARVLLHAPVAIWADTPQEHLPRPWYKRLPRRAYLDWLLPRLDVVFATGKPGMAGIEAMGVSPERIVDLPYFVDPQLPVQLARDSAFCAMPEEYRARLGCVSESVVCLLAGQLTYKKGPEIAIQAFAEAQQHTAAPMGLLIAGDGPRRQELETLTTELGVAERTAFLGWLDPTEMQAAHAASDVLLHSARWEPYGLVVLESMSWGKVVIGSDVTGAVQDRVVHGTNGFVFPSEDVPALAELLRQVAGDRALREKIGAAARATAAAWPVSRGVTTIVQTARAVLAGHGAGR
jgi:glycosyltransferase involved in cell wall biosynthesis